MQCTHWVHVTEENSRKRPKTPRKLAPSQDSSDESESDEEYYTTEDEGKYQYNTRSKGRRKHGSDGDVAGSGRKRKRSENDHYDGNHPRSSVCDVTMAIPIELVL